MKNIEIKPLKMSWLEYELAGLKDRVAAWFIDLCCLTVGLLILLFTGAAVFQGSSTGMTFLSVLLIGIFFFYSLTMEVLNHGQSVGKMALRIQVIKAGGGQATFSDYASRWVFRSIDIWFSLGGIASLMVASSAREQRIGDIVANTAVIKLKPRNNFTLDGLLAIHLNDGYVPKYPAVKQLEESDVLLIKSALDRQAKFRNDAHDEAVDLLTERIISLLEIENKEADERKFLQTLLKDYIVLTR